MCCSAALAAAGTTWPLSSRHGTSDLEQQRQEGANDDITTTQ